MATKEKNNKLPATVFVIVWTLIATAALSLNLFQRFENQSFDLRSQIAVQFREVPKNIKIITVDQASLNYLEKKGISWPWFRSVYLPVLDFLKKSQVKGIAMDILFTESRVDRPDDDLEFVQAVKAASPVVVAAKLSTHVTEGANDEIGSEQKEKFYLSETLAKELKNIPGLNGALLPIPELVASSAAVANVTSLPDSDGVFRHYYPVVANHGRPVASLPLALYRVASGDQDVVSKVTPFLQQGKVIIKYYGPGQSFESIPFAKVFDSYLALEQGKTPAISPDFFKDDFIFIGFTAPGLHDHTVTPISEKYPGVEVNATVLGNILESSFIKPLSLTVNIVFAFVWILLAVSAVFSIPDLRRLTLVIFIILTLFTISHFSLVTLGYWSAQVVPLFAVIGSVLSGIAYQYNTEGKQRRYIRNVFSHYLSENVIENVLSDPKALQLGGEKRDLSIFFSDIQGFTTISEKIDPSVLVALLNDYLTRITDIVLANQGTLDKYLGDAVMCFWNAPLEVKDHATAAVKTALAAQLELTKANQEYEKLYGVQLVTRIGIHTGEVTVGNFGSKRRFDYTIIGDAANLASRLEGLNKVFGTKVLVSESTMKKCDPDIRFRPLGSVQVAGKTKAIDVYEPLSAEQDVSTYNQAYNMFLSGQIYEAKSLFSELGDDPVAQSYCERIDTEILPQADDEQFNPVWVLNKK